MDSPDVKTVFGLRVRKLRHGLGWSQEYLAMRVDLDRSYLGSVERGERNISIENLAKIADGLGVSLSHLLDFDDG